MRERRSYVRSNGLVLVDYKGLQIKGKSSAFDVSGVGVRLILNKELKVGSQVELEIYLPGDSQPVRASGEVIWLQKCRAEADTQIEHKRGYFYTGIKFTAIDDNNRDKIANFVYRRLR